jgi:hypothetical protein
MSVDPEVVNGSKYYPSPIAVNDDFMMSTSSGQWVGRMIGELRARLANSVQREIYAALIESNMMQLICVKPIIVIVSSYSDIDDHPSLVGTFEITWSQNWQEEDPSVPIDRWVFKKRLSFVTGNPTVSSLLDSAAALETSLRLNVSLGDRRNVSVDDEPSFLHEHAANKTAFGVLFDYLDGLTKRSYSVMKRRGGGLTWDSVQLRTTQDNLDRSVVTTFPHKSSLFK